MAATAAPRRVARVRWDRISRYALLLVFVVVLLLYVGPAKSYIHTLGESHARSGQVRALEREHARLEERHRGGAAGRGRPRARFGRSAGGRGRSSAPRHGPARRAAVRGA